jgi:hypothetical protein
MITIKRLSLLALLCAAHSLKPMDVGVPTIPVPYDGDWRNITQPEEVTVFKGLLIKFAVEGVPGVVSTLAKVGELRDLGYGMNMIAAVDDYNGEDNSLVRVDGNRESAYSVRVTPALLKMVSLKMRYLTQQEMVKLLPDTMVRKNLSGQDMNPRIYIPGLSWVDMPRYILRYGNVLKFSLNGYANALDGRGMARALEDERAESDDDSASL